MLEILFIIVMMLFLFGITIFVHEWGHFIVAKKCGLVIETFSIGMGPALWKKEIGGIVYKIGAFPIGGYVSLPQLDPAGMEKMQGETESDRKTLPEISPWKKIAVAVAGPFCNIVFAFLLAIIVSSAGQPESVALIGSVGTNTVASAAGLQPADQIIAVNGTPVKTWYDAQVETLLGGGEDHVITITVLSGAETRDLEIQANDPTAGDYLIEGATHANPCVLGQVTPGSPAALAGIKPDDIVVEFGGTRVIDWNHFTELVPQYSNTAAAITVQRGEEIINLSVTPEFNESEERVLVGVKPGGTIGMPWSLSGSPIEQIKSDSSSIFRLLKALTTPSESKQAASGLGGPVAIFTMIWISLKMSMITTIGLIRFININLAVLNLLPLPVLDGGHVCFALWEGITRRKVHPKVVATLVNVFAILLISAMLFLSWRDVDRNWNVSRFFKKAPAEQVVEPAE